MSPLFSVLQKSDNWVESLMRSSKILATLSFSRSNLYLQTISSLIFDCDDIWNLLSPPEYEKAT